ncbi:DUF421 domain-containing protein [Oceanobacillus sp. 143]|uniref:DUF421 domain-containing protein n=1 Tax=Oceanobacillus zhaokaii TaxID=2052660 RepID=A0A345PFQ9_9BACI|nr:DUF421 domain-containing protein [Oceanobacillus zhaokaii]AXI08839.1 DUF421 domain-containing protein [Oceanobacillus zhaokaii]QGS68529.1 DUF421 domain-containing protein [Oceanobacillus sp. 143]
MPEYVLILIRSIGAFLLLLLMTRIMGKKQISQLTFFDYCVGITIGSIAASMSVDQNIKITNGLVSLVIWGLFPIILSYLGIKSRLFSRITDGKPAIIIKNGEVLEKSMKKNQITLDELLLLLRTQGAFRVSDVEMAVLETNGELSVMKKTDQQPITPSALGLKLEQEHSPTALILDGKLITENLSILGYTEEWIVGEIEKQGASAIKEVFLAQIDSKGELYVDLYDERSKRAVVKQRPLLAAELKKLQADLEIYSLETDNREAKEMYSIQAARLQDVIERVSPYLK